MTMAYRIVETPSLHDMTSWPKIMNILTPAPVFSALLRVIPSHGLRNTSRGGDEKMPRKYSYFLCMSTVLHYVPLKLNTTHHETVSRRAAINYSHAHRNETQGYIQL